MVSAQKASLSTITKHVSKECGASASINAYDTRSHHELVISIHQVTMSGRNINHQSIN